MTTIVPRSPYSKEELEKLYPKGLQLQLVQVLLRHGERSPVSARFQNAGLPPYWPYCSAAKRMSSTLMTNTDGSSWNQMQWRRRIESFGVDDGPVIASGPHGEIDAVCQFGELTDKGRDTTLALGQRLRLLYVEQLGFMPKLIADADMIYLRATPIPRALESVQQSFWGMYPPTARTGSFPPPTIVTRTPADETLFPNDSSCRRFNQLSRAFAQRTADRWNKTQEMDYLNKLMSKWMPPSSRRVAVDSHPRLSGIMDTLNATLAHGPETRLPSEFYDKRGREIIDKIAVEEWYSGYQESKEYRTVGIGGLVGDLVERMTGSVEENGLDGLSEIGGDDEHVGNGRGGERNIKFALNGCHDTTLAAVLASLGVFEGEEWPGFTSHIALELFQRASTAGVAPAVNQNADNDTVPKPMEGQRQSLWSMIFGASSEKSPEVSQSPHGIARKPIAELSTEEKGELDGYYIRMRYNDRPMVVPGCKQPGNHLEGDESFCTLAAFKAIADKFTPKNWKEACNSNLDEPAIPVVKEDAGF
ncbi:MAG: histidine acid phosphatase [Lasallia pustulata]|uniref:3-phytase n=1 Tax=Lasallia pustulata TaxID=136370 RepID=A0A5M8PCS5_9LECA|nr:MAG: histidine acid phosphatase [Lasallia pustulata]